MIRLLTGLPRPNGVGEYVAQLAQLGPPTEIFYRRPMSPSEYERSEGRPSGIFRGGLDYLTARWQRPEAVARTHVTWEGYGLLYGRSTRLLTVHHALPDRTPWEDWPMGRNRRRAVFRMARRGHRDAVRFGTRMVVPSQTVASALQRSYHADPARIEVIPHFIDPEFFRPMDRPAARGALRLPGSVPVLLHIGVDDGRKNIPGLLELFRAYRALRSDAVLAQIGRSAAVEAAMAGAPPGSLVYRPSVPREDLPLWYAAADLCVLPTFLEGFGRVALEAAACGRPSVVSDLEVFREELGDHFVGVEPGRWDRWVPEIEAVRERSDPVGLRALVTSRFDRDRFKAAYLRLYREVGWI